MRRRDFVKAVVAASMSAKSMLGQQNAVAPSAPQPGPPSPAAPPAPGPVPWMNGLLEVKPLKMTPLVADAVAQTNANFFTDTQMATLRHLAAILLPASKGFPGALDAGAPEFLDFLIGSSPLERQQLYQGGLDRLDKEATQQFKRPFATVEKAQADQLLRPWLKTWMTDHPPSEPYAMFINLAHSDIRTATINSQAWSEAATAAGQQTTNIGLYWYPIDPDLRLKHSAKAWQGARDKRPS